MTHSLKETEEFAESIKINTFINNMEYRKSSKKNTSNNKSLIPLQLPPLPMPPAPPLPTPIASHLHMPHVPLNLTSNSNMLPPNFISNFLKESITYDRGRSRSRDHRDSHDYRDSHYHRDSRDYDREHRRSRSRSHSREHRRKRSRSRSREHKHSRSNYHKDKHDSKY